VAQGAVEARAVELEGGALELRLAGTLDLRRAGDLRAALRDPAHAARLARVDLSAVESLDGAAAAILADAWCESQARGKELRFDGAGPSVAAMLDLYTERAPRVCLLPPPAPHGLLEHVGRATEELGLLARGALAFLGRSLSAARAATRRPRSVNWADVGGLCERIGSDGAPIVLMIAFLMGVITAYQAAMQMHELGADVFVADLVALSITRELGPLMTAIVVAGRSGAALAAELGTMTVSEEVDALRTLGLDPQRFLVFPRLIAMTAVLPLLTLLSDAVGIGAGLLVTTAQLEEITLSGYLSSTRAALDLGDVFGGLFKALVFGAMIALISCERGLATRGGAAGVGRATTTAVVASLFSLIAADAVFSVLFELYGI